MKTKYIFDDVEKLLEKFRNNLVRLCSDNSITQSELAKVVGCTHETISNYQLGNTSPNLEALLKIANFFKITLNELIDMPTITTPEKTKSEQRYFAKQTGLSIDAVEMLYYMGENFENEIEALDYLLRVEFLEKFGGSPLDEPSVFQYVYEAIHHPNISINDNDKELQEKVTYYINDYYLKNCLNDGIYISVGEFYLQMLNNKMNRIIKDIIWKQRKIQRKAKEELRKKPVPKEY